ncbi:hypothetical protein EJ05DRAFT_514491 [Pseudovirgaria hyperparasitica]|uniref:Uncharacterized protein n=1 Tax=Pseudovirgaria hyperparasitica TaxID=470096 RepID=A0A6A6VV10_9PEZI|nr:uncharacterized protein EJ05DRAFT_514491 [Pseudovirgaria hyperparasitica]KAF2754005.1 hypothetical protein EJ05DRAFT_514491 [Pseudovirgaria hyperparasitica]
MNISTQRTHPSAKRAEAPDPIIHGLATRATSDMKLKNIMSIVAAGKATQDQLRYFQGHIEELKVLQSLKTEEERGGSPTLSGHDSYGGIADHATLTSLNGEDQDVEDAQESPSPSDDDADTELSDHSLGHPNHESAETDKTAPPKEHLVISELARRAQSDMTFRRLLKTVAAGKATQHQLVYFQNHIDKLNHLFDETTADTTLTTISAEPSSSSIPGGVTQN